MRLPFFHIIFAGLLILVPQDHAFAGGQGTSLANVLDALAPSKELLTAEKAFRFSARLLSASRIEASWQIAPGYYLYRQKFEFKVKRGESVATVSGSFPAGLSHDDPEFGSVEIYRDDLLVTLPISPVLSQGEVIELTAHFQGCADRGVCYPPMTQTVRLDGSMGSDSPPPVGASGVGECTMSGPEGFIETEGVSEQCSVVQTLKQKTLLPVLLSFLGMGVLLSLTPCVFPMIPILSGIIVGHGARLTSRRGFFLSLSYVTASALTYMMFGIIAGLFGHNLQAYLQDPWVIGVFSGLFVILGLSMFGAFDFQMPGFIQDRLTRYASQFKGGSYINAAIMGALSSLIVGPCVAAPLAGALIYIGESGDAVLGGAALFALGLGMGAPLLLIGLTAGRYLPKAGVWMEIIRQIFGLALLGTALWLSSRILPEPVTMALWGVFLVIAPVSLGALEAASPGWPRFLRGIGVVVLIYGGLILMGFSQGGTDPFFPLQITKLKPALPKEGADFRTITSIKALDDALSDAEGRSRPVLIDFYADWCVSCKEMDRETFKDPQVIALLRQFDLIRIDVTQNQPEDLALLHRFHLIGPPGVILFDRDGQEDLQHRVIGYMESSAFQEVLRKVLQ